MSEPSIAFPYKPPSEHVKKKYAYIFDIKRPLKPRIMKLVFDKFFATIFLIFLTMPVLIILKVSYLIESLIDSESKGPILFYYYAVSGGKKFKQYKIRIIKQKFVDKDLAASGDWHAYKNEWMPASRTFTGRIVKAFYLDELPQFWSILKGDMSFVGPRPLACHHYEKDINQGNITRSLIRGGLLGLGHIHKGTAEMGTPDYEYEYVDSYLHKGPISLLTLDIWVIWKGIQVVLKGKGL